MAVLTSNEEGGSSEVIPRGRRVWWCFADGLGPFSEILQRVTLQGLVLPFTLQGLGLAKRFFFFTWEFGDFHPSDIRVQTGWVQVVLKMSRHLAGGDLAWSWRIGKDVYINLYEYLWYQGMDERYDLTICYWKNHRSPRKVPRQRKRDLRNSVTLFNHVKNATRTTRMPESSASWQTKSFFP